MKNYILQKLPTRAKLTLKRWRYSKQIKRGEFRSPEPEWVALRRWIGEGARVVDVGANVGHYTLEMSHIVGPSGAVVAFEPNPETFETLKYLCDKSGAGNCFLLNYAASNERVKKKFTMPTYDNGLENPYQFRESLLGDYEVQSMKVDDFVKYADLVKIDVEGFELEALQGMPNLLNNRHPVVIVERNEADSNKDYKVIKFMKRFGYTGEVFAGSPNRVFTWNKF